MKSKEILRVKDNISEYGNNEYNELKKRVHQLESIIHQLYETQLV